MKRLILVVLIIAFNANAQNPSIAATQLQLDPHGLLVTFKNVDNSEVTSYRLFIVSDSYTLDPNGKLVIASQNVTDQYIDATVPPISGMASATVRLKQPLKNSNYVLVAFLRHDKNIAAKIDPKGSIAVWDMRTAGHELKVSSPVYLNLAAGQNVTIQQSRAKVDENGNAVSSPKIYQGTVSFVEDDGAFIKLSENLPAGQTSEISIVGLPVPAEGKIDLSGAPKNESDAYMLAKASAVAAVHQAPVFTLTGSIAPLHPALQARYWGSVRVDPSVVFDIGLRSTKTANSITVPAPFSRTFLFGLPKDPPAGDFRDKVTPNPVGFGISFGPRYETDRTFKRVNLLGSLRSELYIPALSKSVEVLQARASSQSPTYRNFVQGPSAGFQFTPYVEVDAGAHARDETISNATSHSSEIVPEHTIARLVTGMTSKIQVWHFQLSCDAAAFDMFSTETIGYSTKTGVALRRLSGWHPHTKPDLTYFLDPAHHYGLDITYENGRTAPNFEYLNTVNVGIKVIY